MCALRCPTAAETAPSSLPPAATRELLGEFESRVARIQDPELDPEGQLYIMPEDAEGRKAVLRALLGRFQKEEEEWSQVMAGHERMGEEMDRRKAALEELLRRGPPSSSS